MSIYDGDEEQQVEAIKDWWQANGKAVIIGVVVGIGGIVGWRYYQDTITTAKKLHHMVILQSFRILKQKVLMPLHQRKSSLIHNDKTSYAVLTALQLAKVQIDAE